MNKSREIWEWIRSIAIAVLLALLFRSFLFQVFIVDGKSMHPTLEDHERLVVNKLVYRFDSPRPGDIIVFEYEPGVDYIKRVIGVGGDTVQIINGKVYHNGAPLEEPYLHEHFEPHDYGPAEVPPGFIFVLGDYRKNSKDSRDPRVGFISLEDVKGRAFMVIWPLPEARVIVNGVPDN